MNRSQLRRLSQSTLRELGLQPPLDVELLRERLAVRRGRQIILSPSRDLVGRRKFGFTWDDPAADAVLIMYEARTTWSHQLMIILHELAHLICEHPGHAIDHSYRAEHQREFQEISPQALAAVLGDEPPSTRRRRRSRTKFGSSLYDEAAEWEAETMATIMSEWVPGYGGYVPPPPKDQLQSILGDVTAW